MPGPESSAPSSRALVVMFALVALMALGLLTLSWHASLLDRYEFRQLQTALSTWWIVQEGWQLDYLTPLFGPPWSVPMEFPTYQIVVAAVHHLTGMALEQAGRLTGIAFLFACLPPLYDLLGLAPLRPSRRLIVLAVVLTSPVYLFYARTFMIETTALCFCVWFLACFRRSLEQFHWGWILATTLAATLAALTKITTFVVFGPPALALAGVMYCRPALSKGRTLLGALIPAAVSLSLAWWWIRHGDVVKDSNPFTGFLTARELRTWNFGPWSLRWDWSFWVHLQENIVGYNLAEGAIAIAALCVPFASVRSRWMAAAGVLGFATGPLLFANLYHIHDYYYAANALLLLAAAGLMLAAAWDNPRLPRGTNWLALGLVLSFQLHAFYRGYYSHHRNPAPPPPELAGIIRDHVPSEGVVLIYGADWDPLLPYYFQRRALMVPGERENETEVLEQVLSRLPPRKIAALVIHGDRLRHQVDFIRERTAHFDLSPEPAARDAHNDLYLPYSPGQDRLATIIAGAPPRLQPAHQPDETPFPTDLKPEIPIAPDSAIFSPEPVAIRSRYGVSLAELDGRPILNAHAPSELVFRPPSGSRHLRAVTGLAPGAYAPGAEAVTDGITIEILAVPATGSVQRLYQRGLDPVHTEADRGMQVIELELPRPFSGDLILRLGNGPDNNPTKDWSYWAGVEIH